VRTIRQDDFSAGVVDIDRANVPPNAVFDATNVLLDGEAALRRRGGTLFYGSDRTPSWLWHGVLAGGRRTLVRDTTLGAWCVLEDESSGSPAVAVASLNLGAGGGIGSANTPAHAVLDGILFIAPGTLYAGSRKTAAYSAGTVAVTNGSAIVTKAAGGFTANVDAGMLFRVSSAVDGRYYAVTEVISDTQVRLSSPFLGATNAAIAFSLASLGTITTHTGNVVTSFSAVAAVASRLALVATTATDALFSGGTDPDTGTLKHHEFDISTGRHVMPAGAEIKALASLRDRLFVFTTEGVYVISNMAYEIVDFAGNPQHRVELYTKDVRAVNQPSIVVWRDALIVPGVDDVVLLDGESAPVAISQGARRAWRTLITGGSVPGQAVVYLNYLVLPIGTQIWLFKMDAPVPDDDGPIFPMTMWSWGALYGTTAFALRPVTSGSSGHVKVLGANPGVTGIFNATECFLGGSAEEDHANADGFGGSYPATVTTRDFEIGDAREGLLRRVRAWYELADLDVAVTWGPTNYGGVRLVVETGGARSVGSGSASSVVGGESSAQRPVAWEAVKQAERVRLVLSLYNNCTDFALLGLELMFRESQRAY
jgi:hypothetical protein